LTTLTTSVISVIMPNTAKKPIYLRGIPSDVVREAKAVAARRGVTLAGFVADAIARALREPAGNAVTGDDELGKDMRWYERNRERLTDEFTGGQYVAIVDARVIDHDADFEALAERVFAREGQRDVFMPRLGTEQTPLRVRSPRSATRVQRAR
jgi:hypothetical protein